jgi:ATP-dependent DNA helicase RecG
MDEDRLQELMQSPEGENLEFKQALLSRKAIGEYAVGIGNEGGGWLILGVSDKAPRKVVGIDELSAAELQQIRDAVLDATGIRVEPHVVPSEGRIVLALRIPGRPRGQIFSTRSGKYLMRSGEGLRGMTLTEIEAIRMEELRYRDVLAEPVDLPWQEVIDGLELRRLRRVLKEKSREELALLEEEELLRSLELLAPAGRSGTTRAAILLVGTPEAIREHVPLHEVKLQRYGRDELTPIFNEDLRAPILAVLQRASEVIELVNTVESFQSGLYRVDIPMFPERAYREAVANALIHRDYELPGNVAVRVYGDRLEVGNPGGWFGGVNAGNVLVTESRRRNDLLASVLQRIGLAERSAIGVRRMFEAMLSVGKEPPEYRSTSSSVTVTLRNGSFDRPFARLVRNCADEGAHLSLFDLLILIHLRRHREITLAEAAARSQQPVNDARRILDRLRSHGLLEGRGRGGDRRWVLSRRVYEELEIQHLSSAVRRP